MCALGLLLNVASETAGILHSQMFELFVALETSLCCSLIFTLVAVKYNFLMNWTSVMPGSHTDYKDIFYHCGLLAYVRRVAWCLNYLQSVHTYFWFIFFVWTGHVSWVDPSVLPDIYNVSTDIYFHNELTWCVCLRLHIIEQFVTLWKEITENFCTIFCSIPSE